MGGDSAPPEGVILDHVQPLWTEAKLGLRVALEAVQMSLANAEVRRLHKRLLLPIVLLMVAVYLAIHAAVLPLRMALWVTGRKASFDLGQWGGFVGAWVPLVAASLFRNIYRAPLDAAFISVLKEVDPKLGVELERLPPRSRREALIATIQRSLMFMAYGPIFWLLGFVPGFNMILRFFFQLYTLGRWVEPTWAVGLAVLAAFPLTAYITGVAVQAFMAELYFLREVLQPYLSRLRLSGRQEAQLITRRRTACLAFLVPVELMLLVPVLGPLTAVLAHAMAAVALKRLVLEDGEGVTDKKGETDKVPSGKEM